MAQINSTWYVNFGNGSTTGYYAVTQWAASSAVAAGAFRRQLATPAVNNERSFVCIVAGTTAATEPSWILTQGDKTTDGTVTWQESTGVTAINGDATNTLAWSATTIKNSAVGLGQVIKRVSGTSYQICSTAGTTSNAAEPSFSDTAGVTTADGTVTWTSLGVVGNFTGWQYPHARLTNAINFATNLGVTFYLAHDHAGTQASALTISTPSYVSYNTRADRIICVNRFGSIPPVSADLRTTAVIQQTGAFDMYVNTQYAYVYGITFKGAVGATTQQAFGLGNSPSISTYEECSFQYLSTHANGWQEGIIVGVAYSHWSMRWINCTVSYGHASHSLATTAGNPSFNWTNTRALLPIVGTVIPNLFCGAGGAALFEFKGLDLTQIAGSSRYLLNGAAGGTVRIVNCKIDALVNISYGSGNISYGGFLELIECSSAGNVVRNERHNDAGLLTTETTIIRTGGASDGTTPYSWKLFSGYNNTGINQLTYPLTTWDGIIWNTAIGSSKTLTVHVVNDGATLTNDDVWIEVDYLGSSATPISSLVRDNKVDVFATPTTKPTSTQTWTTTGLTTPIKQLCQVTFTPLMVGPVRWRLMWAKPGSQTAYACPKAELV